MGIWVTGISGRRLKDDQKDRHDGFPDDPVTFLMAFLLAFLLAFPSLMLQAGDY
jgi:hypothetical protein